ncbi:MAG: hypothetical protein OXE50_09045 [Chloroflexi bacterium]|nr:hypothetical protein [Chloroflexota bacterium]
MTRRFLTALALLALTAAVSAGLVHAQGQPGAERPPYRIDLHAGWSLISFPGDPVDGTPENVMGDSQVEVVWAHQGHQWKAAVRAADGSWRTATGLTTILGGWGYWVYTPAATTIETALSPDTPRPSPEGCGWQLMGIWDAEQQPAGTKVDADDYFAGVGWREAYGFLSEANLWTKVVTGTDGTVEVGRGYWVRVTLGGWHAVDSSGTFCPFDRAEGLTW